MNVKNKNAKIGWSSNAHIMAPITKRQLIKSIHALTFSHNFVAASSASGKIG